MLRWRKLICEKPINLLPPPPYLNTSTSNQILNFNDVALEIDYELQKQIFKNTFFYRTSLVAASGIANSNDHCNEFYLQTSYTHSCLAHLALRRDRPGRFGVPKFTTFKICSCR